MSSALADEGFKLTIAKRGGYSHPNTGELHEGVRSEVERQHILYLVDSKNRLVRKEDMATYIPELVDFLEEYLNQAYKQLYLQ